MVSAMKNDEIAFMQKIVAFELELSSTMQSIIGNSILKADLQLQSLPKNELLKASVSVMVFLASKYFKQRLYILLLK